MATHTETIGCGSYQVCFVRRMRCVAGTAGPGAVGRVAYGTIRFNVMARHAERLRVFCEQRPSRRRMRRMAGPTVVLRHSVLGLHQGTVGMTARAERVVILHQQCGVVAPMRLVTARAIARGVRGVPDGMLVVQIRVVALDAEISLWLRQKRVLATGVRIVACQALTLHSRRMRALHGHFRLQLIVTHQTEIGRIRHKISRSGRIRVVTGATVSVFHHRVQASCQQTGRRGIVWIVTGSAAETARFGGVSLSKRRRSWIMARGAERLNLISQERGAITCVRQMTGLAGFLGERGMHVSLSLRRDHISVADKARRLTIHLTDQALAVRCMWLMTGPAKFLLDRLMHDRPGMLLVVVLVAAGAHGLARLLEHELLGKTVTFVAGFAILSPDGIVYHRFLILLLLFLVTLIAVA